MFVDSNLISYDFMTDFNGLNRHYPNSTYPSGLYDNEKPPYLFGPESSKYPNLTLPCNLYDEFGNEIPYGYYMVVLSDDMKYLNLYQSNELKARVKVIKLVEKMYTKEELAEESEIIERMQKAMKRNKFKKYRQAEEDLIALRQKTEANNYAKIEDSGEGFYIMTYNCNGKKATGIIQK